MACGIGGLDMVIIAIAVGILGIMSTQAWTEYKVNKILKMVKKANVGSEQNK